MTKLGVTPGVHGESPADDDVKKDELTAVKVDPKVFTVLQPISSPPVIITPAPQKKGFSACKWLLLIAVFSSTALITFLLANMYFADQPVSKIFIVASDDTTEQPMPTAEAQKVETPVVLPVTTIDGGSEKKETTAANDNKVIDGSVEKVEEKEEFNPVLAAMQARWFQQQQEAQMWRWRRVQQALYEQQMAREFWQRQQWVAQHQRAEAMARAQWEAAREEQARAEQWRQWYQYQQQWQQPQQWQQQQQQQWPQQQQQQQWPQQQWNQQQQQWPQQPQQQQWPQQHQQPQWQWFPAQPQPQPQEQAHQWQQPQQAWNQENQEQPRPRVILLRSFSRILPVHMTMNNIPMRPEGQPEQELPQPAIHDRIYQQLQRKSQGMELNAPSKPIWTAITPTPETPTTKFDEEAAFQENLKKSLEQEAAQQTTTVGPVESSAENREGEVTDDGVIRDIFSALATAEQEAGTTTTTAAAPSSTENVFKTFANEDDKDIAAAEAKIAAAASTENVFKPFESDDDKKTNDEKSGFADFNADGAPKEEPKDEVKEEPKEETASDPKPTQGTEPQPTDPSTVPVVVFEDRFPRIEERTTTPEVPLPASSESAETPVPSEEVQEHDPLAAFLKYFEQEARRMAEMRAATSIDAEPVDVPRVVEGEAAQEPTQPAVDVPEPHFKPAAPVVTTA